MIATGATARTLPGASMLDGVHTLRSLGDAVALRRALAPGTRVVVVGGGFIGCEVACSARRAGAGATVVEAARVPLVRGVGEPMGAALASVLERHDVDLRCGVTVASLSGTGRVQGVNLSDGTTLSADVVGVGVGVTPATEWLENSGLHLYDGVLCDETLNTGRPHVHAAADVARWFNALFGETMRLEHWSAAAEQGALAARNALSGSTPPSMGGGF